MAKSPLGKLQAGFGSTRSDPGEADTTKPMMTGSLCLAAAILNKINQPPSACLFKIDHFPKKRSRQSDLTLTVCIQKVAKIANAAAAPDCAHILQD
jgi:hypothetical protein